MPLVAGVDSSTSACKVTIHDADTGELVSSGRAPHPPTTPPCSEQDPSAWWAAFQHAWSDAGADGIVYPSVRNAGGQCFAAFYPDVMSAPVQGRHLSYHWDGARIDMIKDLGAGSVYAIAL